MGLRATSESLNLNRSDPPPRKTVELMKGWTTNHANPWNTRIPPNFHSGDQGNGNAASSPEDDQNNRSPDPELDSAILGNDQLAYDLAHDNNGPWNSPGADEQSAQLFLSELTDHQRAVIRILAHRQVDQMFKRLGFSDIDPESDVYREQYNLIVTMMVGGGMILGHPQEATAPSVTHQDHVDPYDGQHRRLVERIERGNRTDRVKSFDFSRVSDQNESPVLQEPPMMKEEEVTPLLSNGTAPPPVTETVQPVVTTRSSMPVAPTSVNDGTTRNAHQREPRIGKTLKDKVILQRWRNKDIKDTGHTDIADQGIYIDDEGEAFIIEGGIANKQRSSARQAVGGTEPSDGGDSSSDDAEGSPPDSNQQPNGSSDGNRRSNTVVRLANSLVRESCVCVCKIFCIRKEGYHPL